MPEDYPRIQFRSSDMLDRNLTCRTDGGSSVHSVAKRDLEAYYDELVHALPSFSESDALFIVDVLNGARISPDVLHYLRRDVIDEARESGNVDLVERLKVLSRFEWRAVVDAVQRYWIGPYWQDDALRRLRQIGLVGES